MSLLIALFFHFAICVKNSVQFANCAIWGSASDIYTVHVTTGGLGEMLTYGRLIFTH